jgi:hypothetical protein
MAAPITASEIRDVVGLAALRDEWTALLERSNNGSPYNTPEFLLPWIGRLRRSWSCRALVAHSRGKLIGLAPFFERRVGPYRLGPTIRSFPMQGTTPPFDIVASERVEEVSRMFLHYLCDQRGWDLLWLHAIPSNSPALPVLQQTAAALGMSCVLQQTGRSFFVPIEGTWDQYLMSQNKKFRQNNRRGWQALKRLGKPRVVTYPGDVADLETAMTYVRTTLAASWKGSDGASSNESVFLNECANQFDARGQLLLRFLFLDDTPIAHLLQIYYKECSFAVHNGYNLEFQRASPGAILIHDALRDSFERRHRIFDFSGSRDYLRRWSDHEMPITEMRLMNLSSLSRLKSHIFFKVRSRRYAAARRVVDLKKLAKLDAYRHLHGLRAADSSDRDA